MTEMNNFYVKSCSKCYRELPRDNFHFHKDKNSMDGFYGHCKECRGGKFSVRKTHKATKEGYIKCLGCNEELPSTIQFFHQNANGPYGLNTTCRKCRGYDYEVLRERQSGFCSIDGCSKNAIKRGFCDLHYRRSMKHGDPKFEYIPEKYQPSERLCLACGELFIPDDEQRTRPRKYCSDACGKVGFAIERAKYRKTKECLICGNEFRPQHGSEIDNVDKYCSKECFSISTEHVCIQCGKTFMGFPFQISCSDECSFKRAAHTKRMGVSVRKARMMGASRIERIDPFVVFERDKWKCHLCGGFTSKIRRGTRQDNAPEVDHIIPLSVGGTHTYDNVACSCRKCNMSKGNRIVGQLRLIG